MHVKFFACGCKDPFLYWIEQICVLVRPVRIPLLIERNRIFFIKAVWNEIRLHRHDLSFDSNLHSLHGIFPVAFIYSPFCHHISVCIKHNTLAVECPEKRTLRDFPRKKDVSSISNQKNHCYSVSSHTAGRLSLALAKLSMKIMMNLLFF